LLSISPVAATEIFSTPSTPSNRLVFQVRHINDSEIRGNIHRGFFQGQILRFHDIDIAEYKFECNPTNIAVGKDEKFRSEIHGK